MVADRFNIYDHDQLLAFKNINAGVEEFTVSRTTDYSCGIQQRANGRKAPTHRTINLISHQIRERTPPGHTWWADISHKNIPDFAGTRG